MFSIGWIKKSYMFVCVYMWMCYVFQSVDTAGGLYHLGINEVRIRGASFEEVSNILLWGAVSCVIYWTRIVWGFQFSSVDHDIVVPGLGGTVSGCHARLPT